MDGDSGDEGNDEMTCVRSDNDHDQQVGKVPWEADSRDRVMRDGNGGCWSSERKRKVGEKGLRHLKNECYDGA